MGLRRTHYPEKIGVTAVGLVAVDTLPITLLAFPFTPPPSTAPLIRGHP